jgi:hypothetical protein
LEVTAVKDRDNFQIKKKMIRRAEKRDIKGLIALLYQADAVHHAIRPDLFKSDTPKYDEQALETIL